MRIPAELIARAERVSADADPLEAAASTDARAGQLLLADEDEAGARWIAQIAPGAGRVRARLLPVPEAECAFTRARLLALAKGEPDALALAHLQNAEHDAPPTEMESERDLEVLGRTPSRRAATLESARSTDRRRAMGSFYTQTHEIDASIRMALCELLGRQTHAATLAWIHGSKLLQTPSTSSAPPQRDLEQLIARIQTLSLLDPACGAGDFLLGACMTLARLARRAALVLGADLASSPEFSLLALRQSLAARARGIDADAEALALARTRLRSMGGNSLAPDLLHADALLADVRPADLIIGNPPYVRHERIAPPMARQAESGAHAKIEAPASPAARKRYKQELIARARARGATISPRADLYVHFMHLGLDSLSADGVLAFVVSASWLDLDFARELRARFCASNTLLQIHESRSRRSFASADINSVIAIAARGAPAGRPTHFYSWKDALCAAAGEQEINQSDAFSARSFVLAELDPRVGWGSICLRAPPGFLETMAAWRASDSADRPLPLASLAKVRFGLKSGANSFFYVDESSVRRFGLHADSLRPLLVSARECPGYLTSSAIAKRKVVVKSEHSLPPAYVEHGRAMRIHERSSVKSRDPWFVLHAPAPAPLLLPRRIGERFAVFENDARMIEDNNLFGITPASRVELAALAAALNSTFVRLQLELASRPLTGAQPLIDTNVYLVRALLIPDLRASKRAPELADAWRALRQTRSRRPVGDLDSTPRAAIDRLMLAMMGTPRDRIEALRLQLAYELETTVRERLEKRVAD